MTPAKSLRLVPQGYIESDGGKFAATLCGMSFGCRVIEFRRPRVRYEDWNINWTADTDSLRELARLMLRVADIADCKPEALAGLVPGPAEGGVFR